MLGDIYFDDKYGVKDVNKALYYYYLAAKNNNKVAQFNIGKISLRYQYIPHDVDKAIYYLTLSANQNYSLAQYYLGDIYSSKEYNKYDLNKAFYYYQLAANQNVVYANRKLGHLYLKKQMLKEAIHYFHRAANVLDGESLLMLGYMHFFIRPLLNIKLALYYYTQSAKQNHPTAQFFLGILYYLGKYVDQDINKSINYFKLASKESYEANFYLGVIYSNGEYVKPDIDEAIRYFKGGSSFKDQFCKNNLGVIYRRYKKDKMTAMMFFKEAIREKNDLFAMFNLALIYLSENPNDQYTDEIIEYLVKTYCGSFKFPSLLLSIFLTQKNLSIEILKKYQCKNTRELTIAVVTFNALLKLGDKSKCDTLLQKLCRFDISYSFTKPIEIFESKKPLYKNFTKENTKCKMINKHFYDGFGLNLYLHI